MAHSISKTECAICHKNFSKPFSLRRHMVRIHKENTENKNQQNSNITNTSSNISDTVTENKHSCPKCYKSYNHNWCLLRHIDICKGIIDRHKCEYCNHTFKHEKSRFRHYKTCAEKNKHDTINIGTQNNINIGTQINNNNNIIIVYNKSGGTPFTTDHLTAEDFKKILELASPHIDSRAISEFSRQLLSDPRNRCVKKTNIKLGHSQVHTGNNTWELQLDKIVYPQLANDMANNMFEYINAKRSQLKKDVFDRLRDFVDYMADNGYINTDDEERQKEIQNEYKNFVKGLKLIVYGNNK